MCLYIKQKLYTKYMDTKIDKSIEETNYKKILKKGIYLYIKGKKENSPDILKESLKYLDNIKKLKKFNKYDELLNLTESECSKYLKKSSNSKKVNIFKIICKGQVDFFNNYKIDELDFNIYNHENLTPLHYCVKMGDMKILKKILLLGGKINIFNKNGNTLLEYACIEKDPSSIQFIILHGANMKKHLYLRDGNKYTIKNNDIDSAILTKKLIDIKTNDINEKFNFLYEYFNEDDHIGFEGYTFNDIIKGLTFIFKNKSDHYIDNYIQIIKEEINYDFKQTFCCPNKKLDILLFNLIPFINYPFNISSEHILLNEIKFLIKLIFKNNIDKINKKSSKKLINILWKKYINNKLFSQDYIGILTNQLLSKINL